MNSNPSTLITKINIGSGDDKLFKKVLFATGVSILGGFLGYKLYCKYKLIVKKNEQLRFIRNIQLKCYNRSQSDSNEVSF